MPYEIDEETLFFGPCKRRLREKYYNDFLRGSGKGEVELTESRYLLGFNGSNQNKIRKIIFLGKIRKVLTFKRAYDLLSGNAKFKEMVDDVESPLHLKPIRDGYEHRSELHEEKERENEWVKDVIDKNKDIKHVEVKGNKLLLKDPSLRKDIFVRDCCFLCDNLFFAKGKGIDIDKRILNILKENQDKKEDIDKYSIFGKDKDGRPKGKAGTYLDIKEKPDELIATIEEKAKQIKKTRQHQRSGHKKS